MKLRDELGKPPEGEDMKLEIHVLDNSGTCESDAESGRKAFGNTW